MKPAFASTTTIQSCGLLLLVADLHVWTLDEQRKRDQVAGRDIDWAGWLSWAGRDEANTVVRRLRARPELLDAVAQDPPVLRDLLRSFAVDDADLEAMIAAAKGR